MKRHPLVPRSSRLFFHLFLVLLYGGAALAIGGLLGEAFFLPLCRQLFVSVCCGWQFALVYPLLAVQRCFCGIIVGRDALFLSCSNGAACQWGRLGRCTGDLCHGVEPPERVKHLELVATGTIPVGLREGQVGKPLSVCQAAKSYHC